MSDTGDYISREAARKLICGFCLDCDGSTDVCEYRDIQVDRIPAADVRPVVKAHWKPGYIRNVSSVCSNCGHLRLGNGAEWATKLAYFCEKCGADMRP